MDSAKQTEPAPPLRRSQRFAKRAETSKTVSSSQDWAGPEQPPAAHPEPCPVLVPQSSVLDVTALADTEGFSGSNLHAGLWSRLPDEVC